MNILLVEDEEPVADFIRRGLKAEGYSVEHANDGELALEFLQSRDFDVVVLDLMLPGISGTEVCRKMRARANQTPVLMLTALDSTDERVAGLRIGADDYLPKPFDFEELLARLEALHRRKTNYLAKDEDKMITHRGLSFDPYALEFYVDGEPVSLSSKERELAVLLLKNVGRALSRERILNAVWGTQADPMTNIVDVYIGRLRKKFGQQGETIVTLRGAGYRLD
ncbi:response regulator transcription factor [Roseovarius aestuarii]|uniref:Response regulator MprA n=1 Tax=Roseovarius aestuarii TaxID=475083 RepID=A0A1X7BQL7_9RHOB|nr:response regulator transcription factor [Roseovarius aestuarii]SMC11489.1 Response regulator MprA [Roseovarius aestuarii]